MSTLDLYKYVKGEVYAAEKIPQPIPGTGIVNIVAPDGVTPIGYKSIKLYDDAVGTTELVLGTDFTIQEKDIEYSAKEGYDVYRSVQIINPAYQSAVFYADYDCVGGYVRHPSKYVGEFFFSQFYEEISASFPNLLLTTADQTLSATNYPDYVWRLRNQAVRVGSTTAFTGTAAASVITLANNADNNALLAALAEDTLFHGGYTDWRTVTWDGTDYPITNVNAVARTITVTGTPTAGAGSATLYSYRIAGSTTTARLHKADGLVLATSGASGRVAGLRTRDAMQQITGTMVFEINSASGAFTKGGTTPGTTSAPAGEIDYVVYFDSSNSTAQGGARTGANTKDRSLAGYLYVHVGRYIAP